MKVKELVEKLLNHLDPSAEIETVMSFVEDADDEYHVDLADADYKDGKFILKLSAWLRTNSLNIGLKKIRFDCFISFMAILKQN